MSIKERLIGLALGVVVGFIGSWLLTTFGPGLRPDVNPEQFGRFASLLPLIGGAFGVVSGFSGFVQAKAKGKGGSGRRSERGDDEDDDPPRRVDDQARPPRRKAEDPKVTRNPKGWT